MSPAFLFSAGAPAIGGTVTQFGEVIRQGQRRPYVQFGGARPSNRPYYYGSEMNYAKIGSSSAPVRGSVDPMYTRAKDDLDGFDLIGRMTTPPDLPEVPITFRERKGKIPRHWLGLNCYLTAYVLSGECESLASFDTAWSGYVKIYSGGLITDRSSNDDTDWESDDPAETELTLRLNSIYPAGGISFGEKIAATIAREVTDITYASKVVCGQCGPANDGTNWIYAVETGAAGAAPIVHYSVDGGTTWATSSITPAANAEPIVAIRVMGNYLIALSAISQAATQGGYYYTTINTVTGVPSSSWVQVDTNFGATQEPRDMVVLSPREAYIVGDGGNVWKLTDVPSGPAAPSAVTSVDLARVAADPSGDTIVAVGASATVVKSTNRGQTWAETTTDPGAATLSAIAVMDRNRFWVGNASGVVYYTLDGGETAWTTKALDVTPTAIQDIKFPTEECGYIAYTASSLGRIAATISGGYSWTLSSAIQPRLLGVNAAATTQRYNRIATPRVNDQGINANYVALAGLGASTDGALMIGAGNVF
jgi:hypothetical protein